MADDRVGRLEDRVKALEIHNAKRNERDSTVIKIGAAVLALVGAISSFGLFIKHMITWR
ncbi:MAG: hypothetical protein QNJ92_06875 [Alphaproteobacteria bacterium]|nr:hypothetical protein [Alphaproteobacteria bacterium]